MEQRKHLEDGSTHYGLACEWLKDNEELWKGWMKGADPAPTWKRVVPVVLIILVGVVTFIWAVLPMFPRSMGGGDKAWFKASQWFKPTAFWRMVNGLPLRATAGPLAFQDQVALPQCEEAPV